MRCWVRGGTDHARNVSSSPLISSSRSPALSVCFSAFSSPAQIGCRLLQLKLDQGDPAFVAKICGEAQPHLAEMMKDPFGNYLFQKIVDHVDEAARTDLVAQVCRPPLPPASCVACVALLSPCARRLACREIRRQV